METRQLCPPELIESIAATRSGIEELSALGPNALATAAEAAELLGALTSDADLAKAVLVKAAIDLSGQTGLDPRRAADGLASMAGRSAADTAFALLRLGDLGLPRNWSPAQGLDTRQAETLRKMLLAVVSDPRLILARLAEHLVALRHARDLPGDAAGLAERERRAIEARAVFAPLASRLGVWQLKWELEDLAFRYLEPEEYRRIASALNERRADRERYIEGLCEHLRAELHAAGVAADVYGRPKHMYSIHRKMQRKQLAFEQLFDVRAVRIIVATIRDCYAALGVVHGLWTYIPGEFDDYIATPKGNFYRSIHTAVIGPQGRSVEVQIRTSEMHEHAELGVAAHWTYKEGAPTDAEYQRKIEWVRRLLEPQAAEAQTDREFLEQVTSELFEDRVYALTPKGEVVDLPRGATPLDFAYSVHTSLGHRCRGAKVNGRIVPLTYALSNGEIVEIITGKQDAPSRDWLAPEQGFLVSPRNRSKVRAWFRKQDESSDWQRDQRYPRASSPAATPTAAASDTAKARTRRLTGGNRGRWQPADHPRPLLRALATAADHGLRDRGARRDHPSQQLSEPGAHAGNQARARAAGRLELRGWRRADRGDRGHRLRSAGTRARSDGRAGRGAIEHRGDVDRDRSRRGHRARAADVSGKQPGTAGACAAPLGRRAQRHPGAPSTLGVSD